MRNQQSYPEIEKIFIRRFRRLHRLQKPKNEEAVADLSVIA